MYNTHVNCKTITLYLIMICFFITRFHLAILPFFLISDTLPWIERAKRPSLFFIILFLLLSSRLFCYCVASVLVQCFWILSKSWWDILFYEGRKNWIAAMGHLFYLTYLRVQFAFYNCTLYYSNYWKDISIFLRFLVKNSALIIMLKLNKWTI